MAIGAMGNPLKKGNGEVIITAKMKATVKPSSMAGLAVLNDIADMGKQTQVKLVQGGNQASSTFAGVLTHDLFASRVDGDNEMVASVTARGMSIPVQIEKEIADISAGVGVTASGKFVEASDALSVISINADFVTTGGAMALDENGKEVLCALINLHGGQKAAALQVAAKAAKATKQTKDEVTEDAK